MLCELLYYLIRNLKITNKNYMRLWVYTMKIR